jgi:cation diffusion facilitator family transporter
MLGNAVITAAKFTAAMITGSSAMLAEGIHSSADTANQALLLFGHRQSRRPPDREHPFGHGKELYFWALIEAIVLFGVGGGVSIYEGISHLMHGVKLEDPTWNYVVLAISVVAEGLSFMIATHSIRKRYPGRPFREALRESKDPRLTLPFGEDAAALAGLLVAFTGVYLSHRLEIPALDAAASIGIGLILTIVALTLANSTRNLLVGEQVEPETISALKRTVEADASVDEVRRVLTMHMSPDQVLVNLGVRFHEHQSMDDVADAMNRIEKRLREVDGRISNVFIEAETRDDHVHAGTDEPGPASNGSA